METAIYDMGVMEPTMGQTTESMTENTTSCEFEIVKFEKGFIQIMFLPAIICIFILIFLVRRTRLCPGCCHGRPGLLLPVDFIYESERRWAIATVFALMAYAIFSLWDQELFLQPEDSIMRKTFSLEVYGIIKIFLTMFNVLLLCLVYFPLLSCITLRRHILANVMGILYTIPLVLICVAIMRSCSLSDKTQILAGIMDLTYYIPMIVCLTILIISYVMDFVINIYRCIYKIHDDGINDDAKHAMEYIRMLLKRGPKIPPKSMLEKIKRKVRYKFIDGFQYSPRIICTMVVSGFALYRAAGTVISKTEVLLVDLQHQYLKLEYLAAANNNTELFQYGRELLIIFIASNRVCNVSSLIWQVVGLVWRYINYRKHLRLLMKGQSPFSFVNLPSPTGQVVSSMRYSGFQVAYVLWGWIVMYLFLLFLAVSLSALVILPFRDGYNTFLTDKIRTLWPTVLLSFGFYFIQMLLGKFVFLQERGAILALNNRRLFHFFTYFFFVFNVILGLFSCLKRIVVSMVIGAAILSRLDRVLLMEGFERFDPGFKAYLGMLAVDVAHNHPVMKGFIHILQDAQRHQVHEQPDVVVQKSADGELVHILELKTNSNERQRRCVRNKWWKFVTLINNPILILERIEKKVKLAQQERLQHKIKEATADVADATDSAACVIFAATISSAIDNAADVASQIAHTQ